MKEHKDTMTQGVPQRDLFDELEIPRWKMAKIRKDHLSSDDYFRAPLGKGGRGSTGYWLTPEGERKVRILAAAQDSDPQVIHSFIEVEVLGPAPHSAKVFIKVQDPLDASGRSFLKKPCVVPIRLKKRLTRGKKIRVEVVSDRDGTSFRHESLAGYPLV